MGGIERFFFGFSSVWRFFYGEVVGEGRVVWFVLLGYVTFGGIVCFIRCFGEVCVYECYVCMSGCVCIRVCVCWGI